MYFQIQAIKVPVQVLMAALMWMSARKTQVTARMNLIAQIQRVDTLALVNLDIMETDISAQVFIDRSKGGGGAWDSRNPLWEILDPSLILAFFSKDTNSKIQMQFGLYVDFAGKSARLNTLNGLISDNDECTGANQCDQNAICTNTYGSYSCACSKGN